jgi:hypothetical protein
LGENVINMEIKMNYERIYKAAKHGHLNEEDVYEPETDFSDYDVESDNDNFQDNIPMLFEQAKKISEIVIPPEKDYWEEVEKKNKENPNKPPRKTKRPSKSKEEKKPIKE